MVSEQDNREAEVQDALDTTDQLHNDVSRLKRLGILSESMRLLIRPSQLV
jgi:hypothetical protein